MERDLSINERDELAKLYGDFASATLKANASHKAHGWHSPQFAADNFTALKIAEQISELSRASGAQNITEAKPDDLYDD